MTRKLRKKEKILNIFTKEKEEIAFANAILAPSISKNQLLVFEMSAIPFNVFFWNGLLEGSAGFVSLIYPWAIPHFQEVKKTGVGLLPSNFTFTLFSFE